MKLQLDIFISKQKEKLNSDLSYIFLRLPNIPNLKITTENHHLLNFMLEEC